MKAVRPCPCLCCDPDVVWEGACFRSAHKYADAGRATGRKKKGGSKRFGKGAYGVPAASNFMVLLEESGVYDDKVPTPHYLSAEAATENVTCRKFCAVCGNTSSYRCARCREPFCSIRCQTAHKEVQCVKMTL